MTSFYQTQFHWSMLMEVGQIIPYTFPSVSKNHDLSALQVQKSNRMKYDTQTKIVSYHLAHTK